MKLDVIKLDGKAAGSIDLGDDVFGLEPRVDILHRVLNSNPPAFRAWNCALDHNQPTIEIGFDNLQVLSGDFSSAHVTSHFFTFKDFTRTLTLTCGSVRTVADGDTVRRA